MLGRAWLTQILETMQGVMTATSGTAQEVLQLLPLLLLPQVLPLPYCLLLRFCSRLHALLVVRKMRVPVRDDRTAVCNVYAFYSECDGCCIVLVTHTTASAHNAALQHYMHFLALSAAAALHPDPMLQQSQAVLSAFCLVKAPESALVFVLQMIMTMGTGTTSTVIMAGATMAMSTATSTILAAPRLLQPLLLDELDEQVIVWYY